VYSVDGRTNSLHKPRPVISLNVGCKKTARGVCSCTGPVSDRVLCRWPAKTDHTLCPTVQCCRLSLAKTKSDHFPWTEMETSKFTSFEDKKSSQYESFFRAELRRSIRHCAVLIDNIFDYPTG